MSYEKRQLYHENLQGVGGSANPERDNFGRVKPGHSQPADSEEGVEHEQEDRLCDTSLSVDVIGVASHEVVGHRKDCHGHCHTGRTEEHEWSTTNFLNDEDGDESSHEILRAVACSQEFGVVIRAKTNTSVEGRGVVSDQVDTYQSLLVRSRT